MAAAQVVVEIEQVLEIIENPADALVAVVVPVVVALAGNFNLTPLSMRKKAANYIDNSINILLL